MKEIPLTQGKTTVVDDEWYEELSKYKWYAMKNNHQWYAVRTIHRVNGKQKTVHMHRVIVNAPTGEKVDHRDGDGLNNTESNLRFSTHQQNMSNRGANSNNTSGFKGVCWHKAIGKYVARVGVNGKMKHLGCFNTPEEAAAAYNKAASSYHGEFANLNEIGESE